MNLEDKEWGVIIGILGILGAVATLVGKLVWNFVKHKDEVIDDLRRDNQRLQAERDGARAERDAAFRERDAALTQKVAGEARLETVTSERDRLKADAQKYVAAARTEAEKRAAAEKRASEADQKLADAQKRLAEAEGERDRLRDELVNARKSGGELATRLQDLERRLAAEIARRERAEGETADARAEGTRLRGELEDERLRRTEAERDADATRQLLASLREHSNNLETQLRQYEEQINGIARQDGRVWEKPIPDSVPPFVPLARRASDNKPGTPVISLLNLKGGVGKTTITANLAGYLDKHLEKRVLLIDLDHQRSLSQMLLSNSERILAAKLHTVQRFLGDPDRDGNILFDCSHPVPGLPKCRIVTNASPDDGNAPSLDDVEMRLMSEWLVRPGLTDVRFLLREAVQSETIREQFDYVLIDCPPRLTTACINALTASDFLLIPCQTEAVSLGSLEHAFQRLVPLRNCKLLSHLKILGVVANMVPPTGLADESPERVALNDAKRAAKKWWGSPVYFFKTLLRRDENHSKASRYLEANEPLKLGIDYKAIREDITELANELLDRIKYESRDTATVPA